MNRTALLTVLAVGLGIGYVFLFTDWLQKSKIQIGFRNLPRPAGLAQTESNPVQFLLQQEIKVTRIRVFAAPDGVAPKMPARFVWEMIAGTNEIGVTDFVYGQPIAGLTPSSPPARLEPNVTYAITVESKKAKGEKIFRTRGPAPPSS